MKYKKHKKWKINMIYENEKYKTMKDEHEKWTQNEK